VNPSNKSLARNDSYVQDIDYEEKYFHFSIDDTIDVFDDISRSNYASIFQNETLSWLKELHDTYGVKVSCFVMFEKENFSLSECPDSYISEFEENSDWLRFGFHTRNMNTTYDVAADLNKDYYLWLSEMERIVGGSAIDNVVRLQGYQGNYDNISSIVREDYQAIIGLLTADDDRTQYYLTEDVNDYIYSHDYYYDTKLDIALFSTDIRVEYVDDIRLKIQEFGGDAWNNQLGFLEIFTHEWILNVDVKKKVEEFCRWAVDRGYVFEFPEDTICES